MHPLGRWSSLLGAVLAEPWWVVLPTQVKLLRPHGRKLPEAPLERLLALLVLLLHEDNGQVPRRASNLTSTPTFSFTFTLTRAPLALTRPRP